MLLNFRQRPEQVSEGERYENNTRIKVGLADWLAGLVQVKVIQRATAAAGAATGEASESLIPLPSTADN